VEKNFRIEYLPVAEQDLTEIIEYIMSDNPDAALSMLNIFDVTISILETFPLSGAVPNDVRLQSLNYRILVVENYLIFYVPFHDSVEIRRILHGKRKYDFLL
jgi:toxin ParE1/3/4